MSGRWMIYGASGYTGRLITALAVAKGLRPILAGRNAQSILELSQATRLPADVFDLSNHQRTVRRLQGLDVVLNCAGPFSRTARPMLNACLAAKVGYLDITGEIDVFEDIFRKEREVREADMFAIPGVGFDVVPTDTLAALLRQKLPDATRLVLAFHSHGGRPSPGTAKTMVEALGLGGRIRRDGSIIGVSATYKTGMIPFAEGSAHAVTIPWGDIATAYRTTGIGNIEVHMAATEAEINRIRQWEPWRWILSLPLVRPLIQRYIARTLRGPDEQERLAGKVSLWGEVENAQGERLSLTMETPEGYSFTASSALAAVEKVLNSRPQSGVYTPVEAFGTGFGLSLPGVRLTQPEKALH